jgi:hypothetical protein
MCYYYSNQILFFFSEFALDWGGIDGFGRKRADHGWAGCFVCNIFSFLVALGQSQPTLFSTRFFSFHFLFATRHISEELNRAIKSNEAKSILSVIWVRGAGWDFEVGTNLVDLMARVEIGTKPSSKQG